MIKPQLIKRVTLFLLFVFALTLFGAAYTRAVEQPAIFSDQPSNHPSVTKAS